MRTSAIHRADTSANLPPSATFFCAFNLKPTLLPWVNSGSSSENRIEAANRIDAFWLNDNKRWELDFSDLNLHAMPSTLQTFPGLRDLYIQGAFLRDFDNIVSLHRDCNVHIEGYFPAQHMNTLLTLISAPGYVGPKFYFPDADGASQATSVNLQENTDHKNQSLQLGMHTQNAEVIAMPLQNAAAQSAGETPHPSRAKSMLNAFKKKCDICMLPTSKGSDISLVKTVRYQTKPRLHESCLTDTFPRQADAELTIASQRWPHSRISMDLIRESLTTTPGINRNKRVFLQMVQRFLAEGDEKLPPLRKIELLLSAVTHLPQNTNLQVGTRSLTKCDCLVQAMELAIKTRQLPSIILISQRMLNEFPVETENFLIFGIPYPRNLIIEWSKKPAVARRENILSIINQLQTVA